MKKVILVMAADLFVVAYFTALSESSLAQVLYKIVVLI